jgi:hypothetical protein
MTPGRLQARSWGPRVLLVALAAAILAASGCGDDSGDGRLLSRQQAGDLRATLTVIEQDVSAGNCTGAGEQVSALEEEIDSIKRLDRKLRSALRASARRLGTLVSADCGTTTPPTTTETTPTTPEEGATGETGTTGPQGEEKKQKKEKKVPPGQEKKDQDEGPASTGGDEGGETLPPDELNPDGGSAP